MFARLFLIFVTLPLVELFLFLLVGQRIGIAPTLALIVLSGFVGAAVARSQGLRVLAKYREATARGTIPHETVLDGLMILVAGVLLIAPGFFTDLLGVLLLVPPVRLVLRRKVEAALREKIRFAGMPDAASDAGAGSRNVCDVITVEAEVVESHPHRN
ncbi:MAG TPA: FxsA family protein [Bacteroidia bacterium]|nr:FxsA family protein [Bacteroidia bacterium]